MYVLHVSFVDIANLQYTIVNAEHYFYEGFILGGKIWGSAPNHL